MRMAASSPQRTEVPNKMLAFTLLLISSLLNATAGVMAQDDEVVAKTALPLGAEVRGDMILKTTSDPGQIPMLPTLGYTETTEQTSETTVTEETGDGGDDKASSPAPGEEADEGPTETPAPMPSRGDGPGNKPELVPRDDVICVSKEAVQDKNAVSLKLKNSSNCKDTKMKIESALRELCGEDCKLEIYQEDPSDEVIVSGKYVESDVTGMTEKFNNDNIKDKTDVEKAVTRWGKNSKLVLVSLLLTGLLLAALLVAGYYFKTHRKNSKGVRLAESFQVDEENQANTLVSVAPLPQEPLDKPTINGESPPENGTNTVPNTNGHSQIQTQVADTEM
ncbi:hematopoietic progenitor cell antigen CD34 [Mastacembelus armatus]|uniref:Hematopoietic progenitor cell antigen CD34-like n=1 Tax=Mastacembelus armatus TaxID=205130 RepID=A0A7N8Y0D2_9TELE|nr:hematopoietic progenitor cell antigen CD34-like [Mastacembelus armatus]